MELRLVVLLLCAASLTRVDSQETPEQQAISRLCNAATLCRECILASPMCTWCASLNYNGTSRCYRIVDPDPCPENDTQNPMGGVSGAAPENFEGLNQISPSRLSVNVRPGEPVTFPLAVQPANNFPIDLYLLMDLSFSMRDDLENLRTLGVLIAERIVGISSNFTIGFGSFVDKPLAPYVNVNPARLMNPCLNSPEVPQGCQPPYSYRHVVSLTTNRTLFAERVREQVISGNQDSPEGGFDGFLQSIVCTQLIGWRPVSRKLLLFITDAGFHYAGDGKLGGVIIPHDGLCKIPGPAPAGQNIDYQEWDTLDYPSVGQIAEKLRENDIIPIFAAESNAKPFYDALVEELGEGAFSGTLAADSSNVVDLVEDLYNQISQRIVFDPEPVPGVTFNIRPSNCPGPIAQDGTCTGVEIGRVANFTASVTLQECTRELSAGPRTVSIRVVGFGSFEVELSAICNCPCEEQEVENSDDCGGNGTLSCGICQCNTGNFGEFCQCDQTGQTGGEILECPRGPSGEQCTSTDRGTCICGECQCRRDASGVALFYGPACECDDSQCGRGIGNAICSGRGMCTCEGCQCGIEPNTMMPYFSSTADACECTPDSNCVDPRNSTDPCNGHGSCTCQGQCQCDPPYIGTYCEVCSGNVTSGCAQFTCDTNQQCAQCALNVVTQFNGVTQVNDFFTAETLMGGQLPNGTQLLTGLDGNTVGFQLPASFCVNCSQIVLINGTDQVEYEINSIRTTPCNTDRDGCQYRYYVAISTQDQSVVGIHVEYVGVCPQAATLPVPPWGIALIIVGVLLLLGLLALLLLKILLLLLDAIEVRKFEEEVARTKHSKNENPLYRSAQKEYKNPIYGK